MRGLAPFGIGKGEEGEEGRGEGASDLNQDFIRFDDDSDVEFRISTNPESSDSDSDISDLF